ncbi:hypothetical protein [Leptospira kobayashii]|nr:hypothetical protein [Leptospira kobayashii]
MMNKRKLIFFILLILLVFISFTVYFLFFKNDALLRSKKPFDSGSEVTWKQLSDRPDLLLTEDYPSDLKNFLDELFGKETYEWGADRSVTYDYLVLHYPGERASVLYAIYVAYANYRDEIAKWEKDPNLNSWEKQEKILQIRNDFFPKGIKEILFPYHPSQTAQSFLYYTENYVQKNPYKYSKERKSHLLKKRQSLYGEQLHEIAKWENQNLKIAITKMIYARELEVMNSLEKEIFLQRILSDESHADFWN